MFKFRYKFIVVICGLLISQLLQAQLDDPTLPPNGVYSSAKEADKPIIWHLNSVLISPQRKIAIINGQSVQIGDTVAGARIQSINETMVKLKHRGEIIRLELFPVTVKTVREK